MGTERYTVDKDLVLANVDIVDVVADAGVELKKQGREYACLCPFHDDHNPSMQVVPKKQIFHCKVCHAGGDVIEFVKLIDKVDFKEALERLAVRAGLMAVKPGGQRAAVETSVKQAEKLRADAAMRKAKREAENERERRLAIAAAIGLWKRARGGEDHPRVRAYLEARGIPVASLPEGKVPPSIRFMADCPREANKEDGPGVNLPALLGLFLTPDRKPRAVQRIYLDPGGKPQKVSPGTAKKTRGSTSQGGSVWLSAPDEASGELHLCEGIETGLAVLAALGGKACVWPVLSTTGYENFRLTPGMMAATGGWVKRVFVWADLEAPKTKGPMRGKRPGLHFATAMAKRLTREWDGLPCRVICPTPETAPARVGPGLAVLGDAKNVDWNHVVADVGPAEAGRMMRAAMVATAPVDIVPEDLEEQIEAAKPRRKPRVSRTLDEIADLPDEGGGGDGGNEGDDVGQDGEGRPRAPIMPKRATERAQEVLGGFVPAVPAGEAHTLRYFGGQWWVYLPWEGRWSEIAEPEILMANVRARCDNYLDVTTKGVKPFAPTDRTVRDIMLQVIGYVGSLNARMPQWLPPAFDDQGVPTWDMAARFDRRLDVTEPIKRTSVIAARNGLLDADEWVKGKVRIVEPTSRWFSRACLPYELPLDEMKQVDPDDEEGSGQLVSGMCERWIAFLCETFNDDEESIQALQEWFGYCLVPDISLHKILLLLGQPGSGKGTIREVLTAMIGEENVAMTTIDKVAGRFDLASMVGRNVVCLPEVRVGNRTDQAVALDVLNSISGGDPQSIEDKFLRKQAFVRMTAKFMLTPNEEPRLPDASAALVRRLLVLRTGTPTKNPDRLLAERLIKNIQGILLWALIGFRRLMRRGKFEQPKTTSGLLNEIKRGMAVVGAFVHERCVLQAGSSVRTSILLEAFLEWFKGEGNTHVDYWNAVKFGRELRAAVGAIDRVDGEGEGQRWKEYTGIRLLERGESADNPQPPHRQLHAPSPL